MDEKVKQINEDIKETFKEVAFKTFKPEDSKVYDTLEVPEHYTVVYYIPDEIKTKFIKIANKIQEIDNSIIMNPPEKYHITLFNCPIATDVEKIKEILKDTFNKHSFKISLTNLITGALGVSIAGFPESYDFVELRKKLYKSSNQEFPQDYKSAACWILLGRFSKPPKMEVIQFVRDNFEQNLGSLEINSVLVLKNHHKILEGAQEV